MLCDVVAQRLLRRTRARPPAPHAGPPPRCARRRRADGTSRTAARSSIGAISPSRGLPLRRSTRAISGLWHLAHCSVSGPVGPRRSSFMWTAWLNARVPGSAAPAFAAANSGWPAGNPVTRAGSRIAFVGATRVVCQIAHGSRRRRRRPSSRARRGPGARGGTSRSRAAAVGSPRAPARRGRRGTRSLSTCALNEVSRTWQTSHFASAKAWAAETGPLLKAARLPAAAIAPSHRRPTSGAAIDRIVRQRRSGCACLK